MREQDLQRLNTFDTSDKDPYFLVYRGMNRAFEKAASYAQGELLDIGCGNKPYEKMFPRVTRYIGCDVVQSSDRRVDVLTEATDMPFGPESFDTVFSSQVIEHVSDHQKLFFEAHWVLRPGGHFIVSGPMYWHLHEEPHDYFRFTKYGLKYLFETAGFLVVDIIPNGGKWALLGQVVLHTIQDTRFHRPLVVRIVNRLFAYLDDKKFNDINTINYVAIARKVNAWKSGGSPLSGLADSKHSTTGPKDGWPYG
jgi:SAM-dependent methyltransferase